MGGKKKYLNIFGSFTEPFSSLLSQTESQTISNWITVKSRNWTLVRLNHRTWLKGH